MKRILWYLFCIILLSFVLSGMAYGQARVIQENDSTYVLMTVHETTSSGDPVYRTHKWPILTAFMVHQHLSYIFDPAEADTTALPPPLSGEHDATTYVRPQVGKTYTMGMKGFSSSYLGISFAEDYVIRFTILPPDSL